MLKNHENAESLRRQVGEDERCEEREKVPSSNQCVVTVNIKFGWI